MIGTRPELIRLSLVFRAIAEAGIENHIVHTGQNYDRLLSDVFFEELGLPKPDTYLGVRADRVGDQIGQIISRSEEVFLAEQPDAVLILGDTNTGLSAISAARHDVPIFHMEAGNRCFDWRVPEEKNRKLIDHISTWLLPYTMRSREYLMSEGIHPTKIMVSGNPILDVLEHFRPQWEASDVVERLGLDDNRYVLATAHREETVDLPERLSVICEGLSLVAAEYDLPVVWSVHPRTCKRLESGEYHLDERVRPTKPFGFFDFIRLQATAFCVVTDSGTVQEESSLLHVPAVTCRETTERPETVECGSNVLCGNRDARKMVRAVGRMVEGSRDWVSPYANDRGVADRVVKYLIGNTA
ncbi:MAG: non-hydrolyzing UDP-N-acetylglucosamine 2-epimerase [Gaiellaceae bacterium]